MDNILYFIVCKIQAKQWAFSARPSEKKPESKKVVI